MRKVILLLSFVSLFWACQKKEYPTFSYPNAGYLHPPRTEAPTPAVAVAVPQTIEAPQALSASATGNVFIEEDSKAAEIPAEAVSSKKENVHVVASGATATKTTWQQKMIAKKIQKQIKKADSPEKAQATKAKADTIALLSLIFGGAGLLLLLAGTGFGLLLGIAGLVMGIIGLSRVKKGLAPASSKTLALLGTIFGGLVTLIGLILIAALSAYGFS